MIAEMEAQIDGMNRALATLKQKKVVEKKKEKKVVEKRAPPPPVASSSKAIPKPNAKAAPLPPNRKKVSKKPIEDNDVLSFEQKKELSDTIGKLDGQKLERVIQIIHEGVPEIRDVRFAQLPLR
jgi:bromodomain-containing factor 1